MTTADGDDWRAPSGAAVDTAGIAQVIGALSELRAVTFLAAPPAGLPTLRWEVDVQPPGERRPARHVIEVWLRPDGCVARLRDATFTPERAACDALRLELLKTAQ